MKLQTLAETPHFNKDSFKYLEKEFSFTISKNEKAESFKFISFLNLKESILFCPAVSKGTFESQFVKLAIKGRPINLRKLMTNGSTPIEITPSKIKVEFLDAIGNEIPTFPSDFEEMAINNEILILDIEDEITYIEKNDHFEFHLTRKEDLFKYIQPSFEQRLETFLLAKVNHIRKNPTGRSLTKKNSLHKKTQESHHMKELNDEVDNYFKNRNLINLYNSVVIAEKNIFKSNKWRLPKYY